MSFWYNYIYKIIVIANLKIKIFFLISLSIVSSLLDIFSISLLIPITNLILNQNFTLFNNIEFFQSFKKYFTTEILLISFSFIFFFKTIITIFIYRYVTKIKLNLQAELRIKLLKKYQNLDHQKFLKRQSSDYVQNITAVVTVYSNVLVSFLRIISETLIIFSILIYFLVLDSQTLLTLIPIFLMFLIFYQIFFKSKVFIIGKKVNEDSKKIIQVVKDSIFGMKEIKISNKENFFNKILDKKAKNIANNSLKYEVILFSPRYIIETLFIFIIIIFFFSSDLSIENNLINSAALIAAYSYAALRLIPSFALVSRLLTMMNNGIAYTEILYNDLKDNYYTKHNKKNIIKETLQFNKLEIKNVSFDYNDGRNLFEDLNLIINKGDSILITGPSGSGKTTLIDILLGLMNPKKGKIILNENPNLEFYINRLSYYVSQQKFLINETIFNNIVMKDDVSLYENLSIEEKDLFNKSIKFSGVEEIINSKKEGIYYYVGEEGSLLSGGQRQRVSIARAIFSNRDLIILDESTSALNKELEEEVCKNLTNLANIGKTIICISHNTYLVPYFKYHYDIKDRKITQLK